MDTAGPLTAPAGKVGRPAGRPYQELAPTTTGQAFGHDSEGIRTGPPRCLLQTQVKARMNLLTVVTPSLPVMGCNNSQL
ncbi:MAG: hypothetical protein HYY01_05285 [Chloroflexi bacterium]|nr:hypothetical protein [Chloroflexota bacterium]